MKIKSFVESLNAISPTIDQVEQASWSKGDIITAELAETIRGFYVLEYMDGDKLLGSLDEFINNTSIGNGEIGCINFFSEIVVKGSTYRCFANFNDHYDVCQDITDRKIKYLDVDTFEAEVVCGDFETFLEFLLLLASYNNNIMFSVPLIQDYDSRLKKLVSAGFSVKWLRMLMLQ